MRMEGREEEINRPGIKDVKEREEEESLRSLVSNRLVLTFCW